MSRAKMSTNCFPPGAEPKGKTEFARFDDVIKRILSVPKTEIYRRIVQASPQAPSESQPS